MSAGRDTRSLADPVFATQEEIDEYRKVNENIVKFRGADQLRNAVNQLQTLLYAG